MFDKHDTCWTHLGNYPPHIIVIRQIARPRSGIVVGALLIQPPQPKLPAQSALAGRLAVESPTQCAAATWMRS